MASSSVYCGVAIIGKLPESPGKLQAVILDESGSLWLCLFWETVVFFPQPQTASNCSPLAWQTGWVYCLKPYWPGKERGLVVEEG